MVRKKTGITKKSKLKDLVKNLHDVMVKEDLLHLNWEEKNNFKISLTRKGGVPVRVPHAHIPAERPVEEKKPEPNYIKSPMNGVFYCAPSPGANPFVREDDEISSGTTVCIIEAMKLMNEVQVERHCKILKILVSNANPVKVNQPLFEIEYL